MKGQKDRPHVRTPGALWFGAPLVLAACVAAEAAPQTCEAPERAPAQVRLSRLVRDGVARLAQSTRRTIDPSQATFVLSAFDRWVGVAVPAPVALIGQPETVRGSMAAVRAFSLDPGHTSSPTAAP
jgi:hypothetical protein